MQQSASRDSARLRSHAPLVGPGGVNCVCCGYAAGTKVKERRFTRHRSKNYLRKMVSKSTLEDV
jgi:hypothetical protein